MNVLSDLNRHSKIQISFVEFHGKWIRSTNLYLFLLVFWFTYLSSMFSVKAFDLAKARRAVIRKNKQLENLNQLLSIEKDKLEHLVKADDLTGLLNRAGLRESMTIMNSEKLPLVPPLR